MASVVPSQVVRLIDRLFDFALKEQKTPLPGSPPLLDRGHATKVRAIFDSCTRLDPALLPDGDAFLLYSSALSEIEAALSQWQGADKNATLASMHGLGLDRPYHPITVIRMVLEKCPDDPVTAAVSDLAFITDPDVRDDLGRDIEESKRALANRAWKGATVVGGSVVEGLLLWALDQKTEGERQAAIVTATAKKGWRSPPPQALEDWKLFQFVGVGAELGLIDVETEKQADLARDFRNYIHPGRVKTRGKKCDEKTALLTRSAVLAVIEDLKKRFP